MLVIASHADLRDPVREASDSVVGTIARRVLETNADCAVDEAAVHHPAAWSQATPFGGDNVSHHLIITCTNKCLLEAFCTVLQPFGAGFVQLVRASGGPPALLWAQPYSQRGNTGQSDLRKAEHELSPSLAV